MKRMKKMLALVTTLAMLLTMVAATGLTAFAAETGSITINNAAMGETYYLFKVLGATTNADGGIDYKEPIPEGLTDYLEPTTITKNGVTYNVIGKKSGVSDEDLFAALKTWAVGDGETPDYSGATTSQKATSNTVQFTNIAAGYYVIISTQGNVVMVDSATNPAAVVYEKNTTEIVNEGKTVDGTSYSIGDTITYTAKFLTANYYGSGDNAGKIYKYVIEDTLPEFLSDVAITSITIGGTPMANAPTAFTNKQITIPWVDAAGNSLYANGAEIVVTYTAKLTSTVNVNADNKNTIGITPYDKNDEPFTEPFEKSAEITTYAAALKKTDGTNALAGAKFTFKGLTTEKTADGVYTVVSYDSESTAAGTEMEVGADGMLYIVGLAEDVTLTGTETVAPDGYNKLTETFDMPAQVLKTEVYKESGTRYYDADGNLVKTEAASSSSKTVEKNLSELDATAITVVNNAGTELPSTGGIGTTIFYILGTLLVVGCGIVLVSRKRMENNK